MDPRQLLEKQHRQVASLFKQIEKAEADEARALLDELRKNLELHMKIEEEMFYPAMREAGPRKAEEMVAEVFEEHGVVKLVLGQLPETNPDDERFHAKMTVFRELIQHHVDEEEKEMFKLADKLEDEELESLAERMEAEVEAAGMMPEASRRRAA